ncbi:uncharacterized protein DKFZp434B061-like [Oryctolagus cuniculus]|uniref:uncharacterized protein DKFZp434B061-like n=1 Tax=Oryctolagus cuniculus TaxID=9986 RepID=UPI00387A771A
MDILLVDILCFRWNFSPVPPDLSVSSTPKPCQPEMGSILQSADLRFHACWALAHFSHPSWLQSEKAGSRALWWLLGLGTGLAAFHHRLHLPAVPTGVLRQRTASPRTPHGLWTQTPSPGTLWAPASDSISQSPADSRLPTSSSHGGPCGGALFEEPVFQSTLTLRPHLPEPHGRLRLELPEPASDKPQRTPSPSGPHGCHASEDRVSQSPSWAPASDSISQSPVGARLGLHLAEPRARPPRTPPPRAPCAPTSDSTSQSPAGARLGLHLPEPRARPPRTPPPRAPRAPASDSTSQSPVRARLGLHLAEPRGRPPRTPPRRAPWAPASDSTSQSPVGARLGLHLPVVAAAIAPRLPELRAGTAL